MKEKFGLTPSGEEAELYTISCGSVTAAITNYGAALVRLLVPDREGKIADVVLGCDDASGYYPGSSCLGATVGRNANRIGGATFSMDGRTIELAHNDNRNNLHSGPNGTNTRLWKVDMHTQSAIRLRLDSPHGDQGFPGNAIICVTYALEAPAILSITYDAVADSDTVFNLTNHSYFNLAGHEQVDVAMEQELTMPARFFTVSNSENIPTGELRDVSGTPMDFRMPKALCAEIGADYESLKLQNGYDHNWEVFCAPCAILRDPRSGRTMSVETDCPGIQVYTGNYLDDMGKGGVYYGKRSGVALETQFFPDSVNHPEWKQPFVKAGEKYHSVTKYAFSW